MKRIPGFLKNKYLICGAFVAVYILFIHDTDIATLINRKQHVAELQDEIDRKKKSIEELKVSLNQLNDLRTLEKYAREEHFFRKDDEDIFIFSFE